MNRPIRFTPTTVIALIALFFALGGSAFALGTKVAPQARCANGAVRGIAEVTGQPTKGVANMPDQFTSDPSMFGRKFSCTGGAIQARRLDTGVFEVKFVGNPATSAVATTIGPDAAAVAVRRTPDGVFHVAVGTKNQTFTGDDAPFTIVLF